MSITVKLTKLTSEMESRFTSGNSVPVQRAFIRKEEWEMVSRILKNSIYMDPEYNNMIEKLK